ncbi:MAG: OPT/YSL family transporter [Defluviitaleaceae bacterium]|nr:OPT/YSL family transporter [Defluviitaleaceae bacterium]MCL2238485.1 OPT/YSL family transporter [Defluviitaleaceae bacterium]
MENKKISIKEPGILILGILLAVISAAICMQIMGQLGTAPNTSLIGAVLIMIFTRIPLVLAKRFKNLERQNYVLSIASAAGFTAANCGFVAVATMFILGRNDLILPIAFGTLVGSMIAVFVMGWIFDSKIFPVSGAWPMGQAVATTIEAGDAGGKKGFELLQGLGVGALASFLGIPAAGVGIAFIANMITMTALGIGMILRGFSTRLFNGFDIGDSNIAQGMMIGAGVVALVQVIHTISKGNKKEAEQEAYAVSDARTKKVLAGSLGLFTAGAVAVALITGAFSEMGVGMSVGWVAFAGFSSVAIMVLVGTAGMHSGWAPGFAVVTIFLTLGMMLGFPAVPLAILIGYIGSMGMPLFDTGVGLKTGWLIRGKGADPERERHGRNQQVRMKQLGVIIGVAMSLFFGVMLINNEVIPPMSIFYAYTVGETVNPALIRELALWAIPGAVLQAAFGNKSVGLMIATGLLINNPVFGITLLVSILIRRIFGAKHMGVRAPGLIAGDGLFGFGANIVRAFF